MRLSPPRVNWVFLLLQILGLVFSKSFEAFSFNRFELEHYKNETKELFDFAFDNYLKLGFPYDELYPIKCGPKTRNFTSPSEIANDVLGNFSATLIDSLTTLAVMGDSIRFENAVNLIKNYVPRDFDIDSTIQIFETTIRIVGGLLSGHLYATDPAKKVFLGSRYDGHLLESAKALADRLLPAYLTQTGLPIPRINLKHEFNNISPELVDENNPVAMACPMVEFTLLSYLTYDDKYRHVTRYAFNKTWAQRSDLNLLPMSFNPQNSLPYNQLTGIGASIDSFYEYALKGAILFDDEHLMQVWEDAYLALKVNAKGDWFFSNIDSEYGQTATPWIDSLSAFFPGLQVLGGDVDDAKFKHVMFLKLWNTYGGIPERWNFQIAEKGGTNEAQLKDQDESAKSTIALEWYPLRPEFIESTYFLYRATKDPFYLHIGWNILQNFKKQFRTECGFAGLQDVITGEPQDRMETFVLSETLKYLYLLFDENNELHFDRGNVLFSTEAHPFWLTVEMKRNYERHRFFNDRLYKRHLKNVEQRELSAQRGSPLFHMFRGLSNSIFPKDLSVETRARSTTAYQPDIVNRVCPNLENLQCSKNTMSSPMLTSFDRLFEVNWRYAATLIQPSRLLGSTPMELTQPFYDRWYDPAQSKCRVKPTTLSFEMAFDASLPGGQTKNSNVTANSLNVNTLAGYRLRIEVLTPGATDIYGMVLDTRYFTNISLKNVHSPRSCLQFGNRSPASVYRITAIDGTPLPNGFEVKLNKEPLFSSSSDVSSLGYNSQNILLLDCVPVVNAQLAA